MSKKLIMLIGLPGSGKSRVANRLQAEHGFMKFSTDDVRKSLSGDMADQRYNDIVYSMVGHGFRVALAAGIQRIVLDFMNLSSKHRQRWIDDAAERGMACDMWYLNTPLQVCTDRQDNADREVRLDWETMQKLHQRLEVPKEAKCLTSSDVCLEKLLTSGCSVTEA